MDLEKWGTSYVVMLLHILEERIPQLQRFKIKNSQSTISSFIPLISFSFLSYNNVKVTKLCLLLMIFVFQLMTNTNLKEMELVYTGSAKKMYTHFNERKLYVV